MIEKEKLKNLLPKIKKDRHKYQAGFVVAIAGSPGMQGAAKLSALSALRSGCGIVKLISEKEIPNLPLEIVNLIIKKEEVSKIKETCNKASSVFIGPGMGREEKVQQFL